MNKIFLKFIISNLLIFQLPQNSQNSHTCVIPRAALTMASFATNTQQPTLSTRGWIVNPFDEIPIWLMVLCIIPALLATILIFMDQQITAVIVNRKENKLKVKHM